MSNMESLCPFRRFRGRIRSVTRAKDEFTFSPAEWEMLRDLPEMLRRPRPGVCSRCNGMGGYTVPMNGGRTFVSCPDCKGSE